MADLSDDDLRHAADRGRTTALDEVHATAARYESGRIVVDLANGCTFVFPASLLEGLAGAAPGDLAEIELLGGGYGLHWERLDVDYTVPGLLAGLFGTSSWLARQAGRSSSPAKAAAARRNGARGGRPRKGSGTAS